MIMVVVVVLVEVQYMRQGPQVSRCPGLKAGLKHPPSIRTFLSRNPSFNVGKSFYSCGEIFHNVSFIAPLNHNQGGVLSCRNPTGLWCRTCHGTNPFVTKALEA